MYARHFIFVFLTVALHSSSCTSMPSDFGETVYSECGGVIDAPLGVISYKPDEPYLPNERCNWLVRVPEATGYIVSLISAGFPLSNENNDTQVIVKGFSFRSLYEADIALKSTEIYDFNLQQILLITFHSGSENANLSHGFTLQYTSNFSGPPTPVSQASVDVLRNNGSGIIKHPQTGNFSNNEISIFIFNPPNNLYAPGRETQQENFTHFLIFNRKISLQKNGKKLTGIATLKYAFNIKYCLNILM